MIKVDGQNLEGKDLSGEVLIYRGGELPRMLGTDLSMTQWKFEGAALRTMRLVSLLSMGDKNFPQKVVDELLSKEKLSHLHTMN